MQNCFDQDEENFIVLTNSEDQYSLWPHWKDVPGGWVAAGMNGKKQECLDYVESNWTDMRPLTLRKWMQEQEDAS